MEQQKYQYLQSFTLMRFILWLSLLFVAAAARADFVETFDNGNDDGDWHLTSDPSRLLRIEPTGGNSGAFLHGQFAGAVPTWYVPYGTANTHFLGNFYADHVTEMSFDINIFSGTQAPDRNMTLDLRTTLGTGDFTKGLEAYYVGTDISILPKGWHTYDYKLNATSSVIPAGWVLLRGNGSPGTAADWRKLMSDVETLGVELGTPGFAYPSLGVWDLGLDNARIVERTAVPEPSTMVLLIVGALALVCVLPRFARARS
jgi:hypothetical protein